MGITIDNRLNFKLQCKNVTSKLSRAHGMMWAISPFFPRNTLITIFYALIYPIIIQDIILWGGAYISYVSNIKILINKILRCILKAHERDENYRPLIRTNALYIELGMMKFEDVYRLFLLKFIHFCTYTRFDLFIKYFYDLLPTHNYGTRGIKINLPRVGLDIQKNFTLYRACDLINELDESFLLQQSNFRLKQSFKSLCLHKYNNLE